MVGQLAGRAAERPTDGDFFFFFLLAPSLFALRQARSSFLGNVLDTDIC